MLTPVRREKTTSVFKLQNPIRNYAWGSYDGLSLWAGIETGGKKPSAECWMGAHPDDPSSLVRPDGSLLPLPRYIHDYPMRSLGEEVFAEYGDLPFLFKALSASMPLSIQVHPDKVRAEAGFARENEKSLGRGAPERNYKDRNHKPELAVALSEFQALCGFRPAREAASLLGPALRGYFGFSAEEGETSFRRLLASALTLGDRDKARIEAMALARAKELAASADAGARAAGETVALCYRHYPHDPGAVSPFFMEVLSLKPGQGIYVPAGVMHAYLQGTILEIMATSDNVIRGGLTRKHIDVDELLRTLDFGAAPRLVEPRAAAEEPREELWDTPAREFALSRLILSSGSQAALKSSGPEILLCTEGEAAIDCAAVETPTIFLKRGESAFLGAACSSYMLRGPATVYRARVGSLSPQAAPEASR